MSRLKRSRLGGLKKPAPAAGPVDVREAAAAYTLEAIATLVTIMRTGASDQVRMQAANALLDRAHGKPARPTSPRPEPGAEEAPREPFVILPDNGRGDNDPPDDEEDDGPTFIIPDNGRGRADHDDEAGRLAALARREAERQAVERREAERVAAERLAAAQAAASTPQNPAAAWAQVW